MDVVSLQFGIWASLDQRACLIQHNFYLVMHMDDASRPIQHKSCWLHAILRDHDLNAARILAVVTGEDFDEPPFLGGPDGNLLSAKSGRLRQSRNVRIFDTGAKGTGFQPLVKLLPVQLGSSDGFPEVDWFAGEFHVSFQKRVVKEKTKGIAPEEVHYVPPYSSASGLQRFPWREMTIANGVPKAQKTQNKQKTRRNA